MSEALRDALASVIRKAGLPPLAKENSAHISKLTEAFRAGQLTLVVGAGASAGSGIPTWSKLVDRLTTEALSGLKTEVTTEAFVKVFGSTSDVLRARYLRALYPLTSVFHQTMAQELLRDYDSETKTTNDTMIAIIDLCCAARAAGYALKIVTYNFEDLLEQNLAKCMPPIKPNVIFNSETSAAISLSPIQLYHVHGLIRRNINSNIEILGDIILTEDEFALRMSDPFHWANIAQLTSLQHGTCLFVGFSLADPNMRRLLDLVRMSRCAQTHYIIFPKFKAGENISDYTPISDRDAHLLDQMRSHFLLDQRVQPIFVEDYGAVANALRRIS